MNHETTKNFVSKLQLKNRNQLEETTKALEKIGEDRAEDKFDALQNTIYKIYEEFCKAVSLTQGLTDE